MRPADVGPLVPLEAEPAEIRDDALVGLLGDAAGVGVLDPQDEDPVVMAGVEPREQRAPRVPDVDRPRRRGREAASDRHPRTSFRNTPTPSTSTSTTSPAASGPTPSGVPVSTTSPGSSVMNTVMYSISVATPKTISAVDAC